MRPNLQPKIYKSPVVAQQLYHMYTTTRYNFVRLKATHKISPLEELVGGRSPPQQFPEVNRYAFRVMCRDYIMQIGTTIDRTQYITLYEPLLNHANKLKHMSPFGPNAQNQTLQNYYLGGLQCDFQSISKFSMADWTIYVF